MADSSLDSPSPGPSDAGEKTRAGEAEKRGADTGQPDLAELLDSIAANVDGDDPTLGDILQALGTRTYGPLLLVPALIALAPTGAIPGMSIVTGTIIAAISLQMLIGRDRIWLPQKVLAFSISRETLDKSISWLKPYAERIDSVLRPRQTYLVDFPFTRVIAVICTVLAALMFPLALLPFAVAAPAAAIVLFSLALVSRDGYLVIAGLALTGLAASLLVYAW